MLALKILITLTVLIVLGIMVGSNLIPTMAVVMFNQPSMALPIGVWLAIAIGCGLLSSSTIQLAIWLERRPRDRRIRQLQQRLQQENDVFTYKSESQAEPVSTPDPPAPKKSIFSNYRSPFGKTSPDIDRPKAAPTRPIAADNDWDDAPVTNRELDWDDVDPPRQRQPQPEDRLPQPSPRSFAEARPIRREEVYDADFRLVQPPYREPDLEELDDREPAEEDIDLTPPATSKPDRDPSRSRSADDEDWGFDFDETDPPPSRKFGRQQRQR